MWFTRTELFLLTLTRKPYPTAPIDRQPRPQDEILEKRLLSAAAAHLAVSVRGRAAIELCNDAMPLGHAWQCYVMSLLLWARRALEHCGAGGGGQGGEEGGWGRRNSQAMTRLLDPKSCHALKIFSN